MTTSTREIISLDGRLSAEFWAAMPEIKPPYELIEGELKRKKLQRQRDVCAASRLAFGLFGWGHARGWEFLSGSFGLRADQWNVFVPAVLGFAPGTPAQADDVYAESAFLVAEVLSPSTAANDRDSKKSGYAKAEVELYLIVDAAQKRVEVYRLNGETYSEPEILTNDDIWAPRELEGLQLELAKLWM